MTQWIDSKQAAKLLDVTRAHFTDRLSKRPDFPAPVINFSQRSRKWRLSDVLAWAGHSSAPSPRPSGRATASQRSPRASRGNTLSSAG